jgi:hypothetical protein
MSEIIKKFYNLFWQNKSCQNLFLLSKEELLDTTTIGSGANAFTFSLPRIIISNAQDNNHFETIKLRTENQNINIDTSLDSKIKYFTPLIEQFFNTKFKKSIDRLVKDIESKGISMLFRFLKIAANEGTREQNIIFFLQEYGFVGNHIKTFKEIENDLERQFIPKKENQLINEQTITTFFEGIKFAKELYVNHSYKKLYSTNQILTNTLNEDEDFNSRINLFHLLYESKIISPSTEDAFIECSNCEPGTYRGVFQLKLNPKKLQKLKCPVCSDVLTYFVPYELHSEIYTLIKKHDGLLLDAFCEILARKNITYRTNIHFINNIEVDCIYEFNFITYVVEAKMYKQNTTKDKLKAKVREHYGKLLRDVENLAVLPEFENKTIVPLLLVNIIDTDLLKVTGHQLKVENKSNHASESKIINIEMTREFLQ